MWRGWGGWEIRLKKYFNNLSSMVLPRATNSTAHYLNVLLMTVGTVWPLCSGHSTAASWTQQPGAPVLRTGFSPPPSHQPRGVDEQRNCPKVEMTLRWSRAWTSWRWLKRAKLNPVPSSQECVVGGPFNGFRSQSTLHSDND